MKLSLSLKALMVAVALPTAIATEGAIRNSGNQSSTVEEPMKRRVVTFKSGTGDKHMKDLKDMKANIVHEFRGFDFVAIESTTGTMDDILSMDDVKGVFDDHVQQSLGMDTFDEADEAHRNLGSYTIDPDRPQWNIKLIGADRVWPTTRGANATVCLVDSGITAHNDLTSDRFNGTSVVDLPWNNSERDHGTVVGGVVAASSGKKGAIGVAPESKLYVVRSSNDDGRSFLSDVVAGVQTCADEGFDIVLLSLGSPFSALYERDFYEEMEERGMLVIASAGNSALSGNAILYPAGYDSVVSVGSVNRFQERSSISAFNRFVDIVAPGEDIVSLTNNGKGYHRVTGTSFSAPHVAGVAALLKSAKPEVTAHQIRSAIFSSAEDLGPKGKDDMFGRGLLSAPGALDALVKMKFSDDSNNDNVDERPVKCDRNDVPLKVTAYTDAFTINESSRLTISRYGRDDVRLIHTSLPPGIRYEPETICTNPYVCYRFVASDEAGDGFGALDVSFNGTRIIGTDFDNGAFTERYAASFGEGCPTCDTLQLKLKTDDFGNETEIFLSEFPFTVLPIWEESSLEDNEGYNLDAGCLDPKKCYFFQIFDFGEDGTGFVDLTYNGESIYREQDGTFGQIIRAFIGLGC